jgi:hypothetical protein
VVVSAVFFPPLAVSRNTATIGRPRLTKLFHTPVSTIARLAARRSKPHSRIIAYCMLMLTGPPRGATFDTAVPAIVSSIDCIHPSPGSAAIQFGA